MAERRWVHGCFFVRQHQRTEQWISRLESDGHLGEQLGEWKEGGFSRNQEKDRGDHSKRSDDSGQDACTCRIHAKRRSLRRHPTGHWRLAAASRACNVSQQVWRLER